MLQTFVLWVVFSIILSYCDNFSCGYRIVSAQGEVFR